MLNFILLEIKNPKNKRIKKFKIFKLSHQKNTFILKSKKNTYKRKNRDI